LAMILILRHDLIHGMI